MDAYKDWAKLFDESTLEIWRLERKELQNVAMLFAALNRELHRLQLKVEKDIFYLKNKLEEKDSLQNESKFRSSLHRSRGIQNFKSKDYKKKSFEMKSPDLFRNVNKDPHTLISDSEQNNVDNFITTIEKSPTISSKCNQTINVTSLSNREKMIQRKKKVKKQLLQNETESGMSVIDCSPEKYWTKNDFTKNKLCLSKKYRSTLNKRSTKSLKRPLDQSKEELGVYPNETFREHNCDESLQFSDLKETKDNEMSKNDNTLITSENDTKCSSYVSCESYMKVYSELNLSTELKDKVNECSKEQHKQQPEDNTMPGFWDLSFDPV